MEMNLHAVRSKNRPKVVLYQYDPCHSRSFKVIQVTSVATESSGDKTQETE